MLNGSWRMSEFKGNASRPMKATEAIRTAARRGQDRGGGLGTDRDSSCHPPEAEISWKERACMRMGNFLAKAPSGQ
jgi:hypothetical protein